MAWSRLDDRFHAHPKIEAAGNAAVGLYSRALSYCSAYSTGGFVSSSWASKAGSRSEIKRLCEVGLWDEVAAGEVRSVTGRKDSGGRTLPDADVTMPVDGYFVPDFLHYNWTKSEAENLRLKRQEAGSKGGFAKAEGVAGATASAEADAWGLATTSRPDPSRPDPNPPHDRQGAGSNGHPPALVPADAGEDSIPWD
jgi:hypothetical protein